MILAQESRYPDLDSYLSRKLIALAILFGGLRLFAYPVLTEGFSSDYDIPTSP